MLGKGAEFVFQRFSLVGKKYLMGAPVIRVIAPFDQFFLLKPVDYPSHGGAVDLASRRQFCLGKSVFLPEKGEEAELLGSHVIAVELFLEVGAGLLVGLC